MMVEDITYRQAMKHNVPHEWAERRNQGLCPVCGKDKTQFAKGLRAFCSPEHRRQYGECFLTWSDLRARIMHRDKYTCQKCGFHSGNSEWRNDPDDRKGTAQKQKLAVWLSHPAHAEIFDVIRAKALLELEELYEQKFKKIMDDHSLWNDNKYDELLSGIALTPQEERIVCPNLNVDHKVALMNGGKMWDESNLWTLCDNCHIPKTKQDHAVRKRTELVGNGKLE